MLLGMSFFCCSSPLSSFPFSGNRNHIISPSPTFQHKFQIEIFPPSYFCSYFNIFTLPHAIQYDCVVYLCIFSCFFFFFLSNFVFGTFEPSSSSFVCLICRIRCSCIHIWHNNCYNLQTYNTVLSIADRPNELTGLAWNLMEKFEFFSKFDLTICAQFTYRSESFSQKQKSPDFKFEILNLKLPGYLYPDLPAFAWPNPKKYDLEMCVFQKQFFFSV